MTDRRRLLALLLLASTPLVHAEEPLEDARLLAATGKGFVTEAVPGSVEDLRQQLADALELNNEQRDQLDQTLSRAEAAEEARDRLREEASTLREQRDGLQERLAALQRRTQEQEAGAAQGAALQEQLAAVRRELDQNRRDRDNLAADARNLAGELRNTRADRDRYQRQAIETADRNQGLLGSLQSCVDAVRVPPPAAAP